MDVITGRFSKAENADELGIDQVEIWRSGPEAFRPRPKRFAPPPIPRDNDRSFH
jgi:hypothetical protein